MLSESVPASVSEATTHVPCRSVIMIGTHQDTPGGISTVVRGYRRAGLFDQFRVRFIASHREGSRFVKASAALRGGLRFLVELLRFDAPLVHVHLAPRASFWRKSVFCRVAEITGRPYLLHVHGSEFMQFHDRECSARSRRLIARTFRKAAIVFALSEQWRIDLLRICPDAHVEVLPNAVPLPDLSAPAARHPSGRLTVVFLGRLGKRKGTCALIEAFARVASSRPDVHLTCGGDGDVAGATRLAQQLGIADKVTCTGWLGPDDAARALSAADVFTLPSHAEGVPMALLEAMSWGLPAVTTPVGGIAQVVTHGESGLLVPPGDVDALAAALGALLDDPQQRMRLGAAARRVVEQQFSIDAAMHRLRGVYARFGLKPAANGT